MCIMVALLLANNRHPVHYPPEDQNMKRYNSRYNSDLLPRWNDMMQVPRQVPVKGHNGYIYPVQQDAEDGVKGAEPDNAYPSAPEAVAQNNDGKEYKPKEFNKEPVPVGRIQKHPVVVMSHTDYLQREIDVHPEYSGLAQSERQAVQAAEECFIRPVSEEPGNERADADYHDKCRIDARTQEHDGDECRKPQGVELA